MLASNSIITPNPLQTSLTDDPSHDEQARLNKYKVTLESTHRRAFYDCATTFRYPHLSQKERMTMYQKYRIECYFNFLASIREELATFQAQESLLSFRSSLSQSTTAMETQNNSTSVANGKLIEGLLDPNGIFIVQALYGDFVRDTTRLGNGANIPGTAIDVTWAVRQAIYNNNSGLTHTVEFQPEGWDDFYAIDKTYKFNQGFFDTNFLIPQWDGYNRLYICYVKAGFVYQGIWDDGETVILPHHEHYLDEPIHWSDSLSYRQQRSSLDVNSSEDFDEHGQYCGNYDGDQPQVQVFLNLPHISPQFLQSAIRSDQILHSKDAINAPSISANNNDDDDDADGGKNGSVGMGSSTGSGGLLHASTTSTGGAHSNLTTIGYQESFLSSLSYLPQHLRGMPLYSNEGIIIPSDVWDNRMKKIKAKRRRNLYIALGLIFSTIFGTLHWTGVIDLSGWTRGAVKKSRAMIDFVQGLVVKNETIDDVKNVEVIDAVVETKVDLQQQDDAVQAQVVVETNDV